MRNDEMRIKNEATHKDLCSVCGVLWRRRTTLEADMHLHVRLRNCQPLGCGTQTLAPQVPPWLRSGQLILTVPDTMLQTGTEWPS